MATYTWDFATDGVAFSITYDSTTQEFTVVSTLGQFDLNALWWNDGVDDGAGVKLSKQDNALNMNGTGEDWDGMAKLSNAGLGTEGEAKSSFISEGETATFSLADFGITGDFHPETGGTLGVRATSVNGGDSFKLVDDTPTEGPPPPEDFFPDLGKNISNVTFYFKNDSEYDEKGQLKAGEDGLYTVKIDVPEAASDDLDDWYDAALAKIVLLDPVVGPNTLVYGVGIKSGKNAFDPDEDNQDDPYDQDHVWNVPNNSGNEDSYAFFSVTADQNPNFPNDPLPGGLTYPITDNDIDNTIAFDPGWIV